MTQRAAPDWERIEGDYRAGLMSLREIASAHTITEGAIRKRARRDGWERNLQAKIQAKAEAIVARRAVVAEGAKVAEREIIEANAERIAQVRGEHRADITRTRALALQMLGELEAVTASLEDFEQLGDALRNPDDRGQDKRNEIYQKVISSAGRVDSLKKLSDTLKTLIGLEREAYGLDAAPDGGATLFGRIERVIVRAPAPNA